MQKRVRIVIPVIAVIIIGAVIWALLVRGGGDETALRLSGNIEVTDAQLSFLLPGRISERLVDEGDSVTAGQAVARLEGADQRLAVAQAQAGVALAEAVLAELEAGSRPESIREAQARVEQARSQLAQLESGSRSQEIADVRANLDRALAAAQAARARLDLAAADHQRSRTLFEQGVIPAQQIDTAATAEKSAARALEQAEAGVDSARQRLSLAEEGPRAEQLDMARASLHQAQAAHALVTAGPRAETIDQAAARLDMARETLGQAQTHMGYTELTAPFDGVVISKSAEAGEYINPGSAVVTIADLGHVWLRAYINETDLGRVRLGQAAAVTTDTFPDRAYQGRISFISDQAEFTPKAVQTTQERVKLMYLIKIALDNPDHELKPGMPADAAIEPGE